MDAQSTFFGGSTVTTTSYVLTGLITEDTAIPLGVACALLLLTIGATYKQARRDEATAQRLKLLEDHVLTRNAACAAHTSKNAEQEMAIRELKLNLEHHLSNNSRALKTINDKLERLTGDRKSEGA